MRLTTPVRNQLQALAPKVTFEVADDFKWLPGTLTIQLNPDDEYAAERLLHEIAHYKLSHSEYDRDIELIAMERDAWELAKTTLAPEVDMTISADIIEDDLDTYRDWLHARSTCPVCGATGVQTGDVTYTCVACRATWDVNRAIGCDLRRYVKH